MVNDIREKAEALINWIDASENGTAVIAIKSCHIYKECKAALRPSREEIADYWEKRLSQFKNMEGHNDHKWLNYTIEELRK